jgi:hypothetical protein
MPAPKAKNRFEEDKAKRPRLGQRGAAKELLRSCGGKLD